MIEQFRYFTKRGDIMQKIQLDKMIKNKIAAEGYNFDEIDIDKISYLLRNCVSAPMLISRSKQIKGEL
jgi:hypothetical protein